MSKWETIKQLHEEFDLVTVPAIALAALLALTLMATLGAGEGRIVAPANQPPLPLAAPYER